jgi:hypothetical protein
MREKLRRPYSAMELLIARVAFIGLFTVATVFVFAALFLMLERDAPGSQVTHYGDALFWTASQMSTVSSSLANPITGGGRALAVALDFTSVAVVSLLFGSIAQHIHITSHHKVQTFRRGPGAPGSKGGPPPPPAFGRERDRPAD